MPLNRRCAHYQRRLLVLTLNSDHFHSRQKLCDIIDHGLAQQQQQPGRGGGLGPTDANMRIAGGGREVRTLVRTGRGDIAKLSQNVQLGAPAASSSRQPAVRCGPVWPLSCLSFCSLTLCRCCLSACHLATYLEHLMSRYLKYTKMITYFI